METTVVESLERGWYLFNVPNNAVVLIYHQCVAV